MKDEKSESDLKSENQEVYICPMCGRKLEESE